GLRGPEAAGIDRQKRPTEPAHFGGGEAVDPAQLLARGVRGEHFARASGIQLTRMDDHAEAEAKWLSRLNGQATVARFIVFEVVRAEDVGGEQAVVARMPIRGM